MKLFLLSSSILIASIALYNFFTSLTTYLKAPRHPAAAEPFPNLMSTTSTIKNTMSKALTHAKIVPRRSGERGHADHGWLNTYHTFSFANYYDPRFERFGSLRVLNEDRVAAGSGFPTHPHRDAEIFSYILSGELTHRDSMIKKGTERDGVQSDDFYRMKRGDVQFTTGGKGIAHSEQNESDEEVHFLQIWALPWARSLTPRYHTKTFSEAAKRSAFLAILSPLKAGPGAGEDQEKAAEPTLPNTIPIHADLVMAAGILPVKSIFHWTVGGGAVRRTTDRKVYVHVPMTKDGRAKVKLEDAILGEGDGAFVSNINAGDVLNFENVGEGEAEVVILDSD